MHTQNHTHTNAQIHISKTICNLFGNSPQPDRASRGNQLVQSQ